MAVDTTFSGYPWKSQNNGDSQDAVPAAATRRGDRFRPSANCSLTDCASGRDETFLQLRGRPRTLYLCHGLVHCRHLRQHQLHLSCLLHFWHGLYPDGFLPPRPNEALHFVLLCPLLQTQRRLRVGVSRLHLDLCLCPRVLPHLGRLDQLVPSPLLGASLQDSSLSLPRTFRCVHSCLPSPHLSQCSAYCAGSGWSAPASAQVLFEVGWVALQVC